MASSVRKLIIIISTSILLQPVIKGQYIIYDDNINENIDLPVLFESNSNSSETFELENNYLDIDLEKELESFYEGRQSRNSEKTRSAHFCMAIPKKARHFGSDLVEFKPSVIKEFECRQFDHRTYDSKINGGICIIPREHCTTKTKLKTFLKRERNSSFPWWFSESKLISVGCNCHSINNGF